jgi:hypothetical protein
VVVAPKAVGWVDGAAPIAPGFVVTGLATLTHARRIYVPPNGDVLVAQSSTTPSKLKEFQDWIGQNLQKRVGALLESPNRITLPRDSDGEVVAGHGRAAAVLSPRGERPSAH